MSNKYSRLSLLLANQGFCVITSVIGMFEDIYNWNKKNLPGYYEIFLDIPLDELKKEIAKEFIKNLKRKFKNIAGLDLAIQKPANPNIHIKDNDHLNMKKL